MSKYFYTIVFFSHITHIAHRIIRTTVVYNNNFNVFKSLFYNRIQASDNVLFDIIYWYNNTNTRHINRLWVYDFFIYDFNNSRSSLVKRIKYSNDNINIKSKDKIKINLIQKLFIKKM